MDKNKGLSLKEVGQIWKRIINFWKHALENAGYHLCDDGLFYDRIDTGYIHGYFDIAALTKAHIECGAVDLQISDLKLNEKHFLTRCFNTEFLYNPRNSTFRFDFEIRKAEDFDFNCLYDLQSIQKYAVDEVRGDDTKGIEELFEYLLLKNFTEEGRKRVLYFADELRKAEPGSPGSIESGPA